MRLTPHFTLAEFRCKDGTAHPDQGMALRLAAHLEVLRCLAGHKPMRIVSGFRTAKWNKKVGGASKSRHLVGDAADLEQTLGITPEMAREAGFTGIGTRHGIVTHVDLRPVPAMWSYT